MSENPFNMSCFRYLSSDPLDSPPATPQSFLRAVVISNPASECRAFNLDMPDWEGKGREGPGRP